MSRTPRAVPAVLAWVAALTVLAACASTSGRSGSDIASGTVASAPSTAASVPAAPATTAERHLPTVPNCGGGAYEPRTLLIVCGSGSTMATEVSWRSWEPARASGSGTVHLQVNGQTVSAPATLLLSDVVAGAVGPQFTLLTVTWTGAPPDGKARETYHLQVQG